MCGVTGSCVGNKQDCFRTQSLQTVRGGDDFGKTQTCPPTTTVAPEAPAQTERLSKVGRGGDFGANDEPKFLPVMVRVTPPRRGQLLVLMPAFVQPETCNKDAQQGGGGGEFAGCKLGPERGFRKWQTHRRELWRSVGDEGDRRGEREAAIDRDELLKADACWQLTRHLFRENTTE